MSDNTETMVGSLAHNLVTRVGLEMTDMAVELKRRILYPIRHLISSYDDILPPDTSSEAMSVNEKCPQLISDGFSAEIVSSPIRRAASLNVSTRKERSLSAATISYSPSAPTQCSRVFLKKQLEAKKSVSLPTPTKPPVERPLTFQRPLPPTPESKQVNAEKTSSTKSPKTPFSQLSYYHNVDRLKAEEMLKNSQDGSFIVRPSAKTQNPLTLTLWFRTRIYNINIRHRSDGKYALGTEKANEQSFNSVEELISNYQMEKLVLYSGGERTGKTLLTVSPRNESAQ